MSHTSSAPPGREARFLTVAETAALLKVSEVTIYRGISAGQFPAVKIRGRYAIPSRVIDELEKSAIEAARENGVIAFRGQW